MGGMASTIVVLQLGHETHGDLDDLNTLSLQTGIPNTGNPTS